MNSRNKPTYLRVLLDTAKEIPMFLALIIFSPLGLLAFAASAFWFVEHWGENHLFVRFFTENTESFRAVGIFIFWLLSSMFIVASMNYYSPPSGDRVKVGNFGDAPVEGLIFSTVWGLVVLAASALCFSWQ